MLYYSEIQKTEIFICNKMNITRSHHVKWIKLDAEMKVPYILSLHNILSYMEAWACQQKWTAVVTMGWKMYNEDKKV